MSTVSEDLDRTYGKSVSIILKPGMAWALYSDNGPGGPCGQSCRTTCPHSVLSIWPNEDVMREALSSGNIGRNKKHTLMTGVVDEWTSGGNFRIIIHE